MTLGAPGTSSWDRLRCRSDGGVFPAAKDIVWVASTVLRGFPRDFWEGVDCLIRYDACCTIVGGQSTNRNRGLGASRCSRYGRVGGNW